MESSSYLVFTRHGSLYAARASAVREILWLPELTPLEESPAHMVGALNLRGRIIAVLDLEHRFGHVTEPYRLSDVVIVLDAGDRTIGVIADEVAGIRDLSKEEMEERSALIKDNRPAVRFIEGVAKIQDSIVMLLNLSNLAIGVDMDEAGAGIEATEHPSFLKGAGQDEVKVFKARAHYYSQPSAGSESTGLIPLAVVALGNEYFGVGLAEVREFSEISDIKTVPCCPEHVLGNVNLRGNIVTIVDVRGLLGLPAAGHADLAKAIIFSSDGLLLGVAVHDVLEVVYLKKSDVTPMPSALPQEEKYARGTARYADRVLTVIDLPMVLASDEVVVDERV